MDYIKCTIPKEKCDLRVEGGSCKLMVECLPVVDRCEGTDSNEETSGRKCAKIDNGYCRVYYNPAAKWIGDRHCPMATHYETEEAKKKRIRVGQQKQRKKR